MSVVLPNYLLTVQLPQPRIVIRTRRHKVCRVGAEGAVPDPALVTRESRLEGKRLGLLVRPRRGLSYLPNLGRVVRAAGCQFLDVWGEEDAGDVLFVRGEVRYGHHACAVVLLLDPPHENIAL